MKNSMLLRTLTVSAFLLNVIGFSGCSTLSEISTSIAHNGYDVYFPIQSQYFRPAGRLKSRDFKQAVLLKNGKILMTAGNIPLGFLASGKPIVHMPEIYNPKTQTSLMNEDLLGVKFTKTYNWFSQTTAIALQDGRVLFVGDDWNGLNPRRKEGESDYTIDRHFPTAYLVDPETGKGKFYYDHKLTRSSARLILKPDGNVLVLGGLMSPYKQNIAAGVMEFNPEDETFKTVGHFKDELEGQPGKPFWLNKEQLILLGSLAHRDYPVELYDTRTNTNQTLTRLPWGIGPNFIERLPDGTLLDTDTNTPQTTKFRIFDPKTKQLTDIPGVMPGDLKSIQLSDGNILLFAGEQVGLFDAKSKSIKIIDRFNRSLGGMSLIVTADDKVYLLGGVYCYENQSLEEGHIQDVLVFDYRKYLHDHAQ